MRPTSNSRTEMTRDEDETRANTSIKDEVVQVQTEYQSAVPVKSGNPGNETDSDNESIPAKVRQFFDTSEAQQISTKANEISTAESPGRVKDRPKLHRAVSWKINRTPVPKRLLTPTKKPDINSHSLGVQLPSASHSNNITQGSSDSKTHRDQAAPASSRLPSRRKRSLEQESSHGSLFEASSSPPPSQRRRSTLRSATGASTVHVWLNNSSGRDRAASNYQPPAVVDAVDSDMSVVPVPVVEPVLDLPQFQAAATMAGMEDEQAPARESPVRDATQEATAIKGSAADVGEVIDAYKVAYIILYVSLSICDYGTVAVSLGSCLTINQFFDTVIAVWKGESENQKEKIAAVTVKVADHDTLVVREGIEDSWLKVLELVDEAPVWEDGRGKCDVRVRIIMK